EAARRARRARRTRRTRRASGLGAGEALVGDAELVALGVLQHGPAVASAGYLVGADNSGAEPGQLVDSAWVGHHQVEVDAVLGLLGLGHPVEVPGGLLALRVGPADGGEVLAAALVERAAEDRRPETGQPEHVVAVEGDVAEPGCHGILP